ncbi:MAG: DNA-binding response regulator, AraC family [Bacilli bacterium]|nr:DNA-binding response regulator, AraC family [Bacilli bacterium]
MMNIQLRDSQSRLLWTARIDYAVGSRVEMHNHEDYEQLLVVLAGEGQMDIQDHTQSLRSGNVYLFLRGVPHRFHFSQPTITLDFKFRVSDQNLLDCLSMTGPEGSYTEQDLLELKQWYKMSLANMREPGSFLPLRIDAGFKGTLLSLFLQKQNTRKEPYLVYSTLGDQEPFVQFLKHHYADKITLNQIAKHFGFNPNYLIKVFHNKTGMTPIQLLQEIRLEKAREYLEFTSLPLWEVAERVGWTLPYFSKILKKRTGQTPSHYRDSITNAIGEDILLEHDFSNEWRVIEV